MDKKRGVLVWVLVVALVIALFVGLAISDQFGLGKLLKGQVV